MLHFKKSLTVLTLCAGVLFLGTQKARCDNGIGIEFGEPLSVGLSLRVSTVALTAGWKVGDNGYFAGEVEYWLQRDDLLKNLFWYHGPGIGVRIGDPFKLSARWVIGLQWLPGKQIEIFGQLAPALQLVDETAFKLGGAVGIRYVF